MSKSSSDPSTRIQLTDTFPEISRKIRAAVTDSIHGITYDPVNRRGTSNLLSILSACIDEPVESIVERYEGKGHGDLKKEVSESLEELLKGPRAEFNRLRGETEYLAVIAKEGAEKARERSGETLHRVRAMVGLY
jgi:tryptophanyl-tRNA synthetase